MPRKPFTLRPFNPQTASPEDWRALNELENCRLAETLPDDPPIPVEETVRMWRAVPQALRLLAWWGWTPEHKLAGAAWLRLYDLENNEHYSDGQVYVRPEHRRRGLGSRLLREIARAAEADGRRVFVSQAVEHIPAGLAFARRVGAEIGLAMHMNQLDLQRVDRALLAGWQERAAERAAGFELVFWDGPYPETELERIAEMVGAMNQAPTGEIDMEAIQWTPQLLRQHEAYLAGRGVQRWTVAAREIASGTLAGYTEMLWSPVRPTLGDQGATGVLERCRERGLGRWLKATMLEKILAERPEARFIRTDNADMNAPMLKINAELGFYPYHATSICQVSIERLKEYLAESSGG